MRLMEDRGRTLECHIKLPAKALHYSQVFHARRAKCKGTQAESQPRFKFKFLLLLSC